MGSDRRIQAKLKNREMPNQGIIASAKNVSVIAAMSHISGVLIQFSLVMGEALA